MTEQQRQQYNSNNSRTTTTPAKYSNIIERHLTYSSVYFPGSVIEPYNMLAHHLSYHNEQTDQSLLVEGLIYSNPKCLLEAFIEILCYILYIYS